MQRTIGLTLGGGGSKGSAHLGVLRELERIGVPVDVISGTSIGAIVGAVVAAGYTAAHIEAVFRQTPLRRLLSRDPARWGLIGSDNLGAVLRELLGDRRIEDLPIPFAAVTVDLVTGQEVVLDRGPVVDAVLASSAIPGVFPPRRSDAMLLADGGVINNVPVNVARRLGAERVIAVDLIGPNTMFSVSEPSDSAFLSLRRWMPITQLTLGERAILLMINTITTQRLRDEPPDLLIAPDVNDISMSSFTSVDGGIAAGIAATAPYLEELDALRRWRAGEDIHLHPIPAQ